MPTATDWKSYTAQFTATQTEAKAELKITFEGTGTIDLDMISLLDMQIKTAQKVKLYFCN